MYTKCCLSLRHPSLHGSMSRRLNVQWTSCSHEDHSNPGKIQVYAVFSIRVRLFWMAQSGAQPGVPRGGAKHMEALSGLTRLQMEPLP